MIASAASVRSEHVVEWSCWSTTVRVVVRRPDRLERARAAVEHELALMDAAASRFRPDSEVSLLAEAGGRPVRVSPVLADAVRAAVRVARLTDGSVDPTLGRAMVAAGYDVDFGALAATGSPPRVTVTSAARASWRDVLLDGDVLTLPEGVLLDLGATGKALAVDRAAVRASHAVGGAVLVAVGGDLRVVEDGSREPWLIELAERPDDPGVAWVHVTDGAVATSTTTARRWRVAEGWAHHVLDPTTGRPARVHWRTATVAAATCVDANAASTAALVKGRAAEPWLRSVGLPARLVGVDGSVVAVGGWPEDAAG
ncbi:MAG TPA: FAD:protein FMN transferase [Candidatus Limnocylindria bacterium]|nr:FAD:protein FMN transferase [Candidatus Limnocylindria bacterium]